MAQAKKRTTTPAEDAQTLHGLIFDMEDYFTRLGSQLRLVMIAGGGISGKDGDAIMQGALRR